MKETKAHWIVVDGDTHAMNVPGGMILRSMIEYPDAGGIALVFVPGVYAFEDGPDVKIHTRIEGTNG